MGKNSFLEIYILKPLVVGEIKSVLRDVKLCFNASWGFNPLTAKLFNLNFHPLEVVDRVSFK